MTNNYNMAAVALLNELTYCRLQAVHEEATGMKEPTPHDIVLSVNGVEAKLDSNAELLTALHVLVYKNTMMSAELLYKQRLMDMRRELNKASDDMYKAYEDGVDIPEIQVNIELRGKRISPTMNASVFHALHQLIAEELDDEDLP